METKISAVEWYENRIFILQIQLEKKEISLGEYSVTRVELFKQAKAMEKEQIIQAITKTIIGSNVIYGNEYPEVIYTAEQYYNETFKSE